MSIQMRRGNDASFDPNKLLPGEWAITLDQKKVSIAFAPGDVKTMATYEDMVSDIQAATQEIIDNLTVEINAATDNASTAAEYAEEKGDYANTQGDYAKLQGQAAEAIVLERVATDTIPGVVKGGGNVEIDAYGKMDVDLDGKLDTTGDSKDNTTTFSEAASEADISSEETHATLFGKILKSIKTFRMGKLDIANIANNDVTNIAGFAWDARRGAAIRSDLNALNDNLTGLRSTTLIDATVTNPRNVIANKWAALPTGINYIASLQDQNYTYTAFIQCAGPNHGACTIIGYALSAPIYGRLDSGIWTWT